MQNVTITSMCYFMRYHIFSLSLVWFGPISIALPRATIKFIKKYILIFFLKKKMTVTRGNALQIAQNQENFRKKYTVTRVVTRVVTRSSYDNALH